jgi:hypothetical protein
MGDPQHIDELLALGRDRARALARPVLDRLRAATSIAHPPPRCVGDSG